MARSRGLGDVYKRQVLRTPAMSVSLMSIGAPFGISVPS
jgi:hypothetical protein